MKKLQYTTNDPSATTDYLAADNTWKTIPGGGGGSGIPHGNTSGTDTYTTTISGVTAYNDADAFLIRFVNGNTTSATLNINSLGAIPLYRNNDGAVIGGDIIAGAEMLCIYNSTTNRFQVIGTAPNTLLSYVTNAESTTITKGQAVYAFGGQGDRLKVKLASNTTDALSAQTIGVVLSTSIGANQKGLIIMQGQIDGLNLFPTSTWSDGDAVYLGATAGSFSHTKPLAPNHLVYLGFVTTASNGSAGRMYVRVQNGYELGEIHDVSLTSPTNGQVLTYNSSTDLWVNQTPIVSTSKSFLTGSLDAFISASTTTYITFGSTAFITIETNKIIVAPADCTLSKFYVRIYTFQPATGSLILTIRKNQADTAVVTTIAAGSSGGTEANSGATSVAFSAGDDISIKAVNNATSNSGRVLSLSCQVEI
jgi:hypothetical protein